MADRSLTAAPRPPVRTIPAAVRVAIVYLAARAVTTGFLLLAAALSGPASRSGADADLGTLSMSWDGQWYWLVGTQGYPSVLPRGEDGAVTQNAWAFMPLYPFLSRALSMLVVSYPLAAVLLALVAGYAACLVLYRMLRERIDPVAAMWAVAFFASGPLAALFQMGYAESLFLVWLFLGIWALMRRRLVWLYPLVVLMGFTRPGVLAFSLLLALYGIVRWLRRRVDPLPAREVVHIVCAGLLAAAVGLSWPVIAGLVTGDPSAYMDTELSWRRGWIGDAHAGFVPFGGFWQATAIWARVWQIPPVAAYAGLAVIVAGIAAALVWGPHVRRLGVEIRLWSAAYLLYLLVVFFPQSSLFRLLVPLAPLYGALALPRNTAWRVGMLLLGLVGQWWWIHDMLAVGNAFTQIP